VTHATADLSVVMPTYNHAKYLPRALQALVTQSVLPAEIIIVNDASTDETPAILDRFAREYPLIHVITNAENRRTFESFRIGLSHATGKYVFCAASDDYVLPGFVEKMVGAMEAFPEAGVCSAYFSIVDGVSGHIREQPSGWCTAPRYFSPDEFEKLIGHSSIPGHASILKRSAFDAAGGFLPELEWHSDWFMSLVVGFREGMCHVPEMLSLLTDMPQSYCSQGMRSEKQLVVLNAVFDRLMSPEYSDVLPSFQRSGVLSIFGKPVLQAAARRSDLWTREMLNLLNSFKTEEYDALLHDPDPRLRELGCFFLGPFWHEVRQRHAAELEQQRHNHERTIAEQQTIAQQLRAEVAEREQALRHAQQDLAEKEHHLGAVQRQLSERNAQLAHSEHRASELQEAVDRMEASYFWKARTLLRDCKNAAVRPLRKAG
jgi:hypothetical protein